MSVSQPLRIVFAGTPGFALPSLEALLDSEHSVCAVYCQPDRPAGRGRKLQAGPVKTRALAGGVPVYQPPTLREPQAQARLAALAPDLMVVAAYGLLLPRRILGIPRLGCVNVHASLLPRWRGAAPVQRAILAGDRETGVCLMQMDTGLDTGPVLARAICPIDPGMNAGQLQDRLAALGARLLGNRLADLAAGRLIPQPQDEQRATYAPKLSKAEAELDWRQDAGELERRVRAFNPSPVAWTRYDGQLLKVWEAVAQRGPAQAAPGQVLAEDRSGLLVASGAGLLRLTRLQLPGKRPLAATDFLNAHRLLGKTLGGS